MTSKTETAKERIAADLRHIADGIDSGTLTLIPHGGVTVDTKHVPDAIGDAARLMHAEYHITADLKVRTGTFAVDELP